MEQKFCPGCQQKLNKDLFFMNKSRHDKLSSYCKVCHTLDTDKRSRLPKNEATKKYTSIKSGCKKRKVNCKISREEFISWYNGLEKKCFYCGITSEDSNNLTWYPGSVFKPMSMSIDRLDSQKDYEIGNITLSCLICNYIKGTILTPGEMKEIGMKYIKPKWQLQKEVKNTTM